MDLSDEADPTERMTELEQQREINLDDEKEPGHNGTAETVIGDLNDALEQLPNNSEEDD
jgi:hypothetical protein